MRACSTARMGRARTRRVGWRLQLVCAFEGDQSGAAREQPQGSLALAPPGRGRTPGLSARPRRSIAGECPGARSSRPAEETRKVPDQLKRTDSGGYVKSHANRPVHPHRGRGASVIGGGAPGASYWLGAPALREPQWDSLPGIRGGECSLSLAGKNVLPITASISRRRIASRTIPLDRDRPLAPGHGRPYPLLDSPARSPSGRSRCKSPIERSRSWTRP
jgi:hypothetical protein